MGRENKARARYGNKEFFSLGSATLRERAKRCIGGGTQQVKGLCTLGDSSSENRGARGERITGPSYNVFT